MLRSLRKQYYDTLRSMQKRFESNKTSESGSEWESTLGLEIHAQIPVSSKLFSSGASHYGLPANSGVNLFDAAIPGTLPVLNKRAVELAVLASLALNCKINPVSHFDRKHYFYSDLPNGYQITQQRSPLAQNGYINYAVYNPSVHDRPYYKCSRIKQIQLEQDSGKSFHDQNSKHSFVDLNRAGVALMELVFEPDVGDAEEAAAVVKELCSILQRLGSCSCKMEEGALRVDANVSVHKKGTELGVRTEVKNIGSIRGVVNAINYEVSRQLEIVKNGGSVSNQTFAWSPEENKTVLLRDKEGVHDYRFMPEPNLPPLRIIVNENSESYHETIKNRDFVLDLRHLRGTIPQLPHEERNFLLEKYKASDVVCYNITNNPVLYKYCVDIMSENPSRDINQVYNILMITLLTVLNSINMDLRDCCVPSSYLGELVDMRSITITPQTCERVLLEMLQGNSKSPREIVNEKNLFILSDSDLSDICARVIEDNEKARKDYLKGKKKVMQFFLKKVRDASDARAQLRKAEEILTELLEAKR